MTGDPEAGYAWRRVDRINVGDLVSWWGRDEPVLAIRVESDGRITLDVNDSLMQTVKSCTYKAHDELICKLAGEEAP